MLLQLRNVNFYKRLSIVIVLLFMSSLLGGSYISYANTKSYNQYALLKNGRLRIAYHYSTGKDLWIDFEKCGPNSLMGISKLYKSTTKLDNTSVNLETVFVKQFLKSSSDWIGPYKVKSNINSYNVREAPFFTGGWHAKNKAPTALTQSYTITIDGKKLQSNKVTKGSIVKLQVINLIQGYNTILANNSTKYILKETVTYLITKNTIDINVSISALDDITISLYYGLQTINTPWHGKLYYEGTIHKPLVYDSRLISNSGEKNVNSDIDKYIIQSPSGDRIEAWIDRIYGIGNMEYVSSHLPCAFTTNYGKSYFNLVNETPLVLSKGNTVYWHGGYNFNFIR